MLGKDLLMSENLAMTAPNRHLKCRSSSSLSKYLMISMQMYYKRVE